MNRTFGSALPVARATISTRGEKPKSIPSTLRLWQSRIASRHELARLDERLLADAGISQMQRTMEIRKPFWR